MICGKPDWCSTTAKETISFCARSTIDADRVSRHGWGVYYDRNSGLEFSCPFYRIPSRKVALVSSLPAPPRIRDYVYRKLIELSPAFTNHAIMNGRGGLRERRIFDYCRYGSLPRTVSGRSELVERLVRGIKNELGQKITDAFQGIPGFWKDAAGSLRLWSKFDSNDNLMLIPFIGPDGLIRACQIRFMKYVPNRSGNYLWHSSSKERRGCSPGTPLHHANPGSQLDMPILVTEGALKAATVQMFLTDRYVVGNSGVATSHREIVKTARGRNLELAFDSDCFTNPHVARSLGSLVALHIREQQFLRCDRPTRVLTWEKQFKGIDDALLAGAPLNRLSVREWLNKLTPECLAAAAPQLKDGMPLE